MMLRSMLFNGLHTTHRETGHETFGLRSPTATTQ